MRRRSQQSKKVAVVPYRALLEPRQERRQAPRGSANRPKSLEKSVCKITFCPSLQQWRLSSSAFQPATKTSLRDMANTRTSSRTLPFRLCNVVGADGEIADDAPLSLVFQLAKEAKLPPKVRHNREVLMFADTPSPQKCQRLHSHRRDSRATENDSSDDDALNFGPPRAAH